MPRLRLSIPALRTVLAALLALAVVGCSASGTSSAGNRRATPPPDTEPARRTPQPSAPGQASATLAAPREVMSGTELYLAYRALLDRYVEPVDSAVLIRAAEDGLQQSLRAQPLLPMFSMPLYLAPQPASDPSKDWTAFGEAYDATVQKQPDWAQQQHLDWLVVRQMVQSLGDGHTQFLTPDDVRRRSETSFFGIGVSLFPSSDGPLVSEVYPNTPAAGAGLRRGDRILEANGQSLNGKPISESAQLIRGPRGTEVRLKIQRATSNRTFEVGITRGPVRIDSVVGGLANDNSGIGYLRIRQFADDTADNVAQALTTGSRSGVKVWIVDLRGNGGGAVSSVLDVASEFLGPNVVTGYETDRKGRKTPFVTQGDAVGPSVPLVVLVDHDVASGAEILAAALRDGRNARLVGVATAGNVGVASVTQLPDGSAIQITEQRYVTSAGVSLNKTGIQPEVEVSLGDGDVEQGRDPQLERAAQIARQAR